jgi:hypothetical protein
MQLASLAKGRAIRLEKLKSVSIAKINQLNQTQGH